MCTLMPQKTPFLTLMLVCTLCEESTPMGVDITLKTMIVLVREFVRNGAPGGGSV